VTQPMTGPPATTGTGLAPGEDGNFTAMSPGAAAFVSTGHVRGIRSARLPELPHPVVEARGTG
jgi:hypothetical protein